MQEWKKWKLPSLKCRNKYSQSYVKIDENMKPLLKMVDTIHEKLQYSQ